MNSLEDHTNALAQYLPGSELFEAKNIDGSNLRSLLRGFAGEFKTAQGYLSTLEAEYFPSGTIIYINEWEGAVGIPESCFSGSGTIEDRQRDVVIKLASLGVQTVEDFVGLAAIFGKAVTVTPLSEEAFPEYSVPFTPVSLPGARFIIVVTGEDLISAVPPYDVPFDLVAGDSVLECLFGKVAPDNCEVIFRNSN